MAENNQVVTINKQWLVLVYLIVPVLAALVAIDWFLLDQYLQPHLTTAALALPLYILIFELPHIVASTMSFADREYIQHYHINIFLMLPIILLGFASVFYISFEMGFLCYALYTIYHFVRQQTGIALTMTRRRDWLHELWTYLGVATTFPGFLIVFAPHIVGLSQLSAIVVVPLSIMWIGVSCFMVWRAPSRQAKLYVAGVSISIITSYIFLLLNYLFLVVFVLRFIHDVTAFIFYIAHDTARNDAVAHNVAYRFLGTFGLPALIATPLLAIVVGYLLRSELMVFQVGVIIIMLIGIMHYYLESVMWKRESIHRQQLRFE